MLSKVSNRPLSKKVKQAHGIFEDVLSSHASDTELLKHQATLSHESQVLALKLKDRDAEQKHELAKASLEIKRLKLLAKLPSLSRDSPGIDAVSSWMAQTSAGSPLATGSIGSEPSPGFSDSPLNQTLPLPLEMESLNASNTAGVTLQDLGDFALIQGIIGAEYSYIVTHHLEHQIKLHGLVNA
jgi:hypothetical protein